MEQEVQREPEPRPLTSKLHIVSTTVLIMAGMGLLDGYLVEQNFGSRRTGVFVMLLIGDVCLLLVLRYVALWVGSEVRTAKRGSSMIEWFLFIFVLDIKMYFVLESVQKKCSAAGMVVTAAPLKAHSVDISPGKTLATDINDSDLHLDPLSGYQTNPVIAVLPAPFPVPYTMECEYSLLAKKLLTFFQAVVIAGLYLLLVGADHLKNLPDLRSLEEVKMRAFWVVIDLLDILELQSTMWETSQRELPYLVVGFVYFYCYIVLIILPPIALAEMSKGESETRPHEMLIYLIASLCVVNVGSTVIRCVLLFRHNFVNTSTVFIGKNVICLGMKITKLIQIRLIENGRLHFTPSLDMLHEDDQPPINLANGNLVCSGAALHKSESVDEEDNKSICPQHGYKNTYSTTHDRWKDSDEPCVIEGCEDFLNHSEDKSRSVISDYSTFAQTNCSVGDILTSPHSNYGDEKITMTCKNGSFSKQVKFYGKNEPKPQADDSENCRLCSGTSCSDVSSLLTRKVRCVPTNPPTSINPLKPSEQHRTRIYTGLEQTSQSCGSGTDEPNVQHVPHSMSGNRHSCIISSLEPARTEASAMPAAWHSTSDVTARADLSDFPTELDVRWRTGNVDLPSTTSDSNPNRFDRGYLSDSEVSDYAPPPPSMTLIHTKSKRKEEPKVNSRSCSAHSIIGSDAESTSV